MIVDHDRDVAALWSRCRGADATGRIHPLENAKWSVRRIPFNLAEPHSDFRPASASVRCTAYTVAAVTPLILLVALRSSSDHPRLIEVSVDIALVGFTLLSLQCVLAGRFAWIEGPLGLDRLFAASLAGLRSICLPLHRVLRGTKRFP
jgi:hypothetical protein